MVINPEATTGHLQPVELSDARFAIMPAPHDTVSMRQTVAYGFGKAPASVSTRRRSSRARSC